MAAAFDKLFYLGSGWVSAWALKTSDGIALIDALNTAEEVDRLIVGGLRLLGLAPSQIKVVLVTHGHGDHCGDASCVKALAAVGPPRVVMSEQDRKMTQTQRESSPAMRPVTARPGSRPRSGPLGHPGPFIPAWSARTWCCGR